MSKKLLNIFIVAIIILSLSSLLFSSTFFIFDLFSHFHLQYMIVLLLLSLLACGLKSWKFGGVGMVYVIVISATFIFPLDVLVRETFATEIATQVPSAQHSKPDVLFMNTLFDNSESEKVSNYILKIGVPTVALVEVNSVIKNSLEEVYGSPLVHHDEGGLSCAIFSKEKFTTATLLEETRYPICMSEFEDFVLLVIHPIPPFSPTLYDAQRKYFQEIDHVVQELRRLGKEVVLVGDFNSTVYSGLYRKYFGEYEQKNMYTWNSPSLLMLPLDHVLSTLPLDVTLGPNVSSDHHMLFVDVK